jgi:hypothetical protein
MSLLYLGHCISHEKETQIILDKIESDLHKIKFRTIISALLHGTCLILTFYAWINTADKKNANYDLYRAAVVGNIEPTGERYGNSTRSFVDFMHTQLNETCPKSELRLLAMEARMARANNAIEDKFTSTWVATKSTVLGLTYIDGYGLLFGIFLVSFISQIKVLLELRKDDNPFFRRPCAARWFEYALTSPLMVTIIAACLLIRDINTIVLLSVAQGALVQFGYAMECSFTMTNVEDMLGCESEVDMISFKALVPNAKTEGRRFPRIAQQLWYWSFTPSMLLHVAIWIILIGNWIEFNSKPCWVDTAQGQSSKAPEWLVAILFGQFSLFSTFILVSIGQANDLCMLPWQKKSDCKWDVKGASVQRSLIVERSFTKAFGRYALLSAAAKVFLGATYLLYVRSFPFYTQK